MRPPRADAVMIRVAGPLARLPTATTCDAVVAALVAELAKRSAASAAGYSAVWRRWRAFLCDTDPATVGPTDVVRWMDAMQAAGRADRTRQWTLSVLRSIYARLVTAEILAVNPAREVPGDRPRGHQLPSTPRLTIDEMQRLLAFDGDSWHDRRDRAIIWTFAGTALRRENIPRLRVEDLRAGPAGIEASVVVKGGKHRTKGIPALVVAELRRWQTFSGIASGPLFPAIHCPPGGRVTLADTPMNVRTINKVFHRVAGAVGLDPARATPHALRRTWVTLARKAGVSLERRQAGLLHENQSTTERYDVADREADPEAGDAVLRYVLEADAKET